MLLLWASVRSASVFWRCWPYIPSPRSVPIYLSSVRMQELFRGHILECVYVVSKQWRKLRYLLCTSSKALKIFFFKVSFIFSTNPWHSGCLGWLRLNGKDSLLGSNFTSCSRTSSRTQFRNSPPLSACHRSGVPSREKVSMRNFAIGFGSFPDTIVVHRYFEKWSITTRSWYTLPSPSTTPWTLLRSNMISSSGRLVNMGIGATLFGLLYCSHTAQLRRAWMGNDETGCVYVCLVKRWTWVVRLQYRFHLLS